MQKHFVVSTYPQKFSFYSDVLNMQKYHFFLSFIKTAANNAKVDKVGGLDVCFHHVPLVYSVLKFSNIVTEHN